MQSSFGGVSPKAQWAAESVYCHVRVVRRNLENGINVPRVYYGRSGWRRGDAMVGKWR